MGFHLSQLLSPPRTTDILAIAKGVMDSRWTHLALPQAMEAQRLRCTTHIPVVTRNTSSISSISSHIRHRIRMLSHHETRECQADGTSHSNKADGAKFLPHLLHMVLKHRTVVHHSKADGLKGLPLSKVAGPAVNSQCQVDGLVVTSNRVDGATEVVITLEATKNCNWVTEMIPIWFAG